MTDTLLEIRHLSKTFAGQRALDDVSLQVAAGEIVALVGQNGSGKSTLIKVLAGYHPPDPGAELKVRDQEGSLVALDAAHTVLHFIHQDLGLVETLSVIENLDLVKPLGLHGWLPVSTRREADHAERLLARFGAAVDVRARVVDLSRAEQTLVAIARALDSWSGSQGLLVLDEPTESLHTREVDTLFSAVRQVAERGAGIVFVSHRLEEVLSLADRVVVLRDGRVAMNAPVGDLSRAAVVEAMAGRADAELAATAAPREGPRECVLSVERLGGETVRSLDLSVNAGEVVGVSGLVGSGREHAAGLIFGAISRTRGAVRVRGTELHARDPSHAVRHGVGLVPGDRRRLGAMMTMSVGENLTLPWLDRLRRRLARLDRRAERAEVSEWIARVDVRPPRPELEMSKLSGGNQQKVVLAKWLHNKPSVLLLDEPTQGIDVAAKAAVYALVSDAAAGGAAVLVCSGDAKELAAICDRVVVLRQGSAVAELHGAALTEARLVHESMAGAGGSAAAVEAPAHQYEQTKTREAGDVEDAVN